MDAARFCLEFAKDFSAFLAARLSSAGPIEGAKPDIAEMQHFLKSPVVPGFVREMFETNRVEIERALTQVKVDPVRDAVASLLATEAFCDARLGN